MASVFKGICVGQSKTVAIGDLSLFTSLGQRSHPKFKVSAALEISSATVDVEHWSSRIFEADWRCMTSVVRRLT